jgi:glucose-1-phosphate thymidylyltransferase
MPKAKKLDLEINSKLDKIFSLKENLGMAIALSLKDKKEIKKGVYLGKNVKMEPNIFFDTTEGDISIGDGTIIKANAVLRGPLLIGRQCVINSFAEISFSDIGNVCKIGGEVEHSIISDYTNKQHFGFFGHSYVGSWVNIGGGTSVSNLKNTYSSIKLGGVDTGKIFLGCIIGDYVKTAINTSIFCGKVIGPSSHLYGTVVSDVPAFTSYISAGKMYELPLLIAIRIQKAMMSRRGVEFRDSDRRKLEKLFKETATDRRKAKVKKSKLTFI